MIYIHVPFCRSFCTYCGFYSEVVSSNCNAKAQQEDTFKRYVEDLCQEIRDREKEIRVSLQSGVDTLYFGGGTPSVLPVEAFQRIMDCLASVGACPPFEEFTVEMNPEDVIDKGDDYILSLKNLGMNRVSMGVQSFDDSMLKWMNRRHSSDGAIKAVSILRRCGIENISLDLIFGISHLSDECWTASINKALELLPEHISAYQLSVEDGSALAKLIDRCQYSEADDELCQRQYSILCNKLKDNGYSHYEVSNFSRPGKHARHNSAYWKRVPYVGLGPGAHSFDGKLRSWNSEYKSGWKRDFEILSDEDVTIETIMLALRTAEGIDRNYLEKKCDPRSLAYLMQAEELTENIDGKIRIPEDKFFISDAIIRDLI